MSESETKSEVVQTGDFDVPAAEVWALVADFGGLDKIMDGVESCEVEGEGIGSKRSIPMAGGTVVEALDVLDDEAMTLTYSIVEGPLPFRDYSATMVVSANDEHSSSLRWTGSFFADGIPVDKAEKLASNIYRGGIAGYGQALKR